LIKGTHTHFGRSKNGFVIKKNVGALSLLLMGIKYHEFKEYTK